MMKVISFQNAVLALILAAVNAQDTHTIIVNFLTVEDATCSTAVGNKLNTLARKSLNHAGKEIGFSMPMGNNEWESYSVDNDSATAEGFEEDAEEAMYNHADNGSNRRLASSTCRTMCLATRARSWCACCKNCGSGRRRLNSVKFAGHVTLEQIAKLETDAEEYAVEQLTAAYSLLRNKAKVDDCLVTGPFQVDVVIDPIVVDDVLMSPTDEGAPSCPSGFNGLVGYKKCTEFHHCLNGRVVDSPLACPDGLLFDESIEVCNWPNAVDMDNCN